MWLIIGYGNRLRQDDGAGYRVAEILSAQLDSQRARVLAVHQLTPELVLELVAADVTRVLFVDACRGQDKPLVMEKLNQTAATGSCGHQMTPELLLHMAQSLYQCVPPGWLLTLAAEQLEMGETFSPTTRAACAAAVMMIESLFANAPKYLQNKENLPKNPSL